MCPISKSVLNSENQSTLLGNHSRQLCGRQESKPGILIACIKLWHALHSTHELNPTTRKLTYLPSKVCQHNRINTKPPAHWTQLTREKVNYLSDSLPTITHSYKIFDIFVGLLLLLKSCKFLTIIIYKFKRE